MRGYTQFDTVLRTLRQFPEGATTKELAQVMGIRPKSMASQLSKAFMYGLGVDRIQRPRAGRCEFVWRVS